MIATTSVTLDIPLHPIQMLTLSETGTMPDARHLSEVSEEVVRYEPRHLPPSNRTEGQLLSVWITTHHAMFMTIAMSTYCIGRAIRAIELRNASESLEWLSFARDARVASAAYTHLPALTQPLYEAYVRESMKLVHAGFSGVSNLESVVMELSLRRLKETFLNCQSEDREFAHVIAPAHHEVAEADQFWWRSHGQAMRRMVMKTVSLARMDAQEKAKEAGDAIDFDAYRERVLRDPKALTEYDAYFAVRRCSGLTLGFWQRTLPRVLAIADDYIAQEGPVAERCRPTRPRLCELLKRAEA